MKERPILFSAAMVRALLAGTKTQTRRVMKNRYFGLVPAATTHFTKEGESHPVWVARDERNHETGWRGECPYGEPGDQLWVRESWAKCTVCFGVDWLADANKARHCRHCDSPLGKGKPSIHLPRSCSRITLELTEVRAERLQDISESDCRAEGIEWTEAGPLHAHYLTDEGWFNFATAREAYADLWNFINGPGSWEKNQWVFTLTFPNLKS